MFCDKFVWFFSLRFFPDTRYFIIFILIIIIIWLRILLLGFVKTIYYLRKPATIGCKDNCKKLITLPSVGTINHVQANIVRSQVRLTIVSIKSFRYSFKNKLFLSALLLCNMMQTVSAEIFLHFFPPYIVLYCCLHITNSFNY